MALVTRLRSFDPVSRRLVVKPSIGSTIVTRAGRVLRLIRVGSDGGLQCTISEKSLLAIPSPVVGATVSYKCRELKDLTFEIRQASE